MHLDSNARMYSARTHHFPSNALKDMPSKRVYQAWKGSNRFFLGGRLIFGPDVRSLLVTIVLIIAPAVTFCVFVAKALIHECGHHAGVAIMVVAGVFTTCVLFLLLLTSGRDPGIIPRNMHPPEPDEEDMANSPGDWRGQSHQTPKFKLPRTKDVLVNGFEVKVKYCDTCMLYRPPRCSHCSICNNCVERFDHHCPWVGQCIGRRNYPFFFMFVLCTTLLCIYVFAMSALHIQKSMQNNSFTVWRALGKSPAAVFLMVYTFISVWFVGGLTVFHLYLISTNQTTYENFRYRYDSRVNPYSLGIVHNFGELFCSSIPPSKNDFRAFVPSSRVQISGVDIQGSNDRKNSSDVEMGGKADWTSLFGVKNVQEPYGCNSHASGIDSEIKEGYEDAFVRALGHPLPHDSVDIRGGVHPRRSSWGRKSRSWEHVPDILALAAGVGSEGSCPNGSSTPPRNR